jgi:hypothetical protein
MKGLCQLMAVGGKLMQRCEFVTLLGSAGEVPMRRAAWHKSPATGSCRR